MDTQKPKKRASKKDKEDKGEKDPDNKTEAS